jgi:hypothetical protein
MPSNYDIFKLLTSAGAGYLVTSLLIPRRGWGDEGFAGGHCDSCGIVGQDKSWSEYVACCKARSPKCPCPDYRSANEKLYGPNPVIKGGTDIQYKLLSPRRPYIGFLSPTYLPILVNRIFSIVVCE